MSIKHSKKFSFTFEKYNNNYSVYNYKKKKSASENFKVSSKSQIWLIFYPLDSTRFGFFLLISIEIRQEIELISIMLLSCVIFSLLKKRAISS